MAPLRAHPTEMQIQIALIEWCRLGKDERRFAFHIANEAKRSLVGYKMQLRQGMRKGAADVFVPAARMGWNGLFLELKAYGKKPTKEQLAFAVDMASCGYLALWADHLDDAIRIVDGYLMNEIGRPGWVHYSQPARIPE